MSHPTNTPETIEGANVGPTHPRPNGCQSWGAGHRVHWIQGMRSNDSEQPGSYVACEVIDADDEGWFTVVITETGEHLRLWNHVPDRVRGLVGLDRLEINERWSVLHRRKLEGGSTTYVSVRDTRTPCVFEEPTGPLEEQLRTHGGFSIAGPDALRLLGEQSGDDEEGDA